MIKVWGRLSSANVQKVIWALEEIEQPYEVEQRGGRYGGLDDPDYMAMNPNALVPTIRDGDLTLWESTAIVRYLCAQYASGLLYPVEPAARAVADQWTDWTISRFQPAWLGVFWRTYRTRPERRDPAAISAVLAEAGKCFAILEARLAQVPYLAGPVLTYADIVAGSSLYRWYEMEIDRPETPAVAAWYARLQKRPAFAKAVMVDFSELKDTF